MREVRQRCSRTSLYGVVGCALPLVQAIDFVERDNERSLVCPNELNGLECLLLKAVHDVHDQDGDIA